jgi:hypothetical protein
MATAKQIESARSFMENVTGLPFLGLTVSENLVVIHFGEWETHLRGVLIPRDQIKIGMTVEIAGVRQITSTSSEGRLRRRN